MNFAEIEQIPAGLLDVSATSLFEIMPQPTLLHLPGDKNRPLFVTVLLHGNEHTGFEAIQQLLKKYVTHRLPRELSIFFGNTAAARFNRRVLDAQPDFNRVWPGTLLEAEIPEVRMMSQIVEIMRQRNVFASIDVHNNTGMNPHYACVNELQAPFLQLAGGFSRTIIYFNTPRGVQSKAMSKLCPATTIECGKSGVSSSAQHAFEFIDSVLHQTDISVNLHRPGDIDLFHTVARVVIDDDVEFGFCGKEQQLQLNEHIDRLNFSECSEGTVFGRLSNGCSPGIRAFDEQGNEVTSRYLKLQQGRITLSQPVMPAMLTLDREIIRQDCLCYFMERIQLDDI